MNVVVLISGSGSNLQSLIDNSKLLNIRLSAVFSNKESAFGLKRARDAGIAAHVVEPKKFADREACDRELMRQIDRYDPGLVVLAGFMRVLSPVFVQHFSGRLLNIHPSLLPKYRGLHTHQRVLQAGDTEHGCSIHFVSDELDSGPLIAQACVPVYDKDDETTLSARVQAREHKLYPLVIGWFCSGRLRTHDGQVLLDDEPLTHPVVYAQNEDIK
ncbi:MAG: phosphoribosylglycinamide formyltransferase [Gammaproteobacteria bacterium]|nr:phosphoribosylglycinamide formyltransferase [Gammaproteobacteria bacterium]